MFYNEIIPQEGQIVSLLLKRKYVKIKLQRVNWVR